jgi:hypothetical protein
VPRRDARCFALSPEGVREPLRVDWSAEFVGEHEVVVDVGVASERTLELLSLAVCPERVDGLRVERDRPKPALRLWRPE